MKITDQAPPGRMSLLQRCCVDDEWVGRGRAQVPLSDLDELEALRELAAETIQVIGNHGAAATDRSADHGAGPEMSRIEGRRR